MNSKTTLFFAIILFAHMLGGVTMNKLAVSANIRLNADAKAKEMVSAGTSNKLTISNKMKATSSDKVAANSKTSSDGKVMFILKDPLTFESHYNLESFSLVLKNLNGEEYVGNYLGDTVNFYELPIDTYIMTVTSSQTIKHTQIFQHDITQESTPIILFLVKPIADSEWLVTLTWKSGSGLFNSGEVSEGHLWSEGLDEKERLLRNALGPQVTRFTVDKSAPEKSFASYEVYFSKGFSNNFDTGAQVRVYNGKNQVAVYDAPQVPASIDSNGSATFWHVFDVLARDENSYHEYNEISDIPSRRDWFK